MFVRYQWNNLHLWHQTYASEGDGYGPELQKGIFIMKRQNVTSKIVFVGPLFLFINRKLGVIGDVRTAVNKPWNSDFFAKAIFNVYRNPEKTQTAHATSSSGKKHKRFFSLVSFRKAHVE